MEGGGIHGIHRRQKFRGSSTLQSKVLIMTDPRAPRHLNSRLLGYVTIWSPRVIVVLRRPLNKLCLMIDLCELVAFAYVCFSDCDPTCNCSGQNRRSRTAGGFGSRKVYHHRDQCFPQASCCPPTHRTDFRLTQFLFKTSLTE